MSPSESSAPAVYDHLQPSGADVPAGVYRVVGVGAETVTLLRVGDADGRRRATGEVVTVDRPLAEFTPADNPDDDRNPGEWLAALPGTVYWSVRAFLSSLGRNPLPAGFALALLVAGNVGGETLPDPAPTLLVAAGALALAYVGSGEI